MLSGDTNVRFPLLFKKDPSVVRPPFAVRKYIAKSFIFMYLPRAYEMTRLPTLNEFRAMTFTAFLFRGRFSYSMAEMFARSAFVFVLPCGL